MMPTYIWRRIVVSLGVFLLFYGVGAWRGTEWIELFGAAISTLGLVLFFKGLEIRDDKEP